MSFFISPASITDPQDIPATVLSASAGPYYPAFAYTWTITDFDSFVSYNVTTTNGSVSLNTSTQVITYTPASSGSGGFSINGRSVALTISGSTTANYLAVGGGGSGGASGTFPSGIGNPAHGGGGGGAGGLLSGTGQVFYIGTPYTITVGAGGPPQSNPGISSTIVGVGVSITALGGSQGGKNTTSVGGSSGGVMAVTPIAGTAGQGNAGGCNPSNFTYAGGGSTRIQGGGGGAGAVGQNAVSNTQAGAGGVGASSSITGSAVTYAGGGGGGGVPISGPNLCSPGAGGAGGGAQGQPGGSGGTANSGGGGGGAFINGGFGSSTGGGSGVVILSIIGTAASTSGSPTVTTSGGRTIYTFTGSGSITF